tara:strand:- start:134 stop:442 length:309 start_codon:yes stop_codon:yes gene_type:complete
MVDKKQKRNDTVNPYDIQIGGSHYKKMKIQPSEFINKNNLPFAEGNAIKYLCRHKQKGQKQDLEKAKHFIDMIIERDYKDHEDKKEKQETWVEGYRKWKANK